MAKKSIFSPNLGGMSFKEKFAPKQRVKRSNYVSPTANAGSASIIKTKPSRGTPAPPYRPSFSSAFSNIAFNS